MSQPVSPDEIAKRRIVFRIAEMDRVRVQRDVPYATRDTGPLTMDLYRPAGASEGPLPAVIMVSGYPDPGVQRVFGCRTKHLGAFVSWAELIAGSGLAAITYENRQPDDVKDLFAYVRQNASALGVDDGRLGVWACSGHGPNALSMSAQHDSRVRCAVLLCPYLLDRPGSVHVANAAARIGFVVSTARSVDDLRSDVPLFVARAAFDAMPGLNAALDEFVEDALARNLPVTLVNHSTGPHAFDLFEDSEASREVIRGAVRFLRFHLGDPSPGV